MYAPLLKILSRIYKFSKKVLVKTSLSYMLNTANELKYDSDVIFRRSLLFVQTPAEPPPSTSIPAVYISLVNNRHWIVIHNFFCLIQHLHSEISIFYTQIQKLNGAIIGDNLNYMFICIRFWIDWNRCDLVHFCAFSFFFLFSI